MTSDCNYGLVLQFHLEQAQLRSKIRIESGRGMYPLFMTHELQAVALSRTHANPVSDPC